MARKKNKVEKSGWLQDLALFPIRPEPKPEGFAVWSIEEQLDWFRKQAETPHGKAKKRLEEHLQAAHLDPVVNASEAFSGFLYVIRSLLSESRSTDSLYDLLLLLSQLHARMYSRSPRGENHPKAAMEDANLAKVADARNSLIADGREPTTERIRQRLQKSGTNLSAVTIRKHKRRIEAEEKGK